MGRSSITRPMSQVSHGVPSKVQSRAWCFTSFVEEYVSRLREFADVQALVIGEEVCPDTGKVHYQGYVRFTRNRRFSWWKNQFPSMHVEVRKGTEAEAAGYCRKEGKVLVDFGCQTEVDRGNSPVEHVLNMLEARTPLWQVYKEHPVFFFHQSKKITEMDALMAAWKECGFRFEKGS